MSFNRHQGSKSDRSDRWIEPDQGPSDYHRSSRSKWDGDNGAREKERGHPDRRRSERSRSPRAPDHQRPRARAADKQGTWNRPESRGHQRSRSRSPQPHRHRSRSPVSQTKNSTIASQAQQPPPSPRRVTSSSHGLVTASKSPRADPEELPQPKDEPNFNQSGKLAAETNTYKGVVLKYHEPPESRKPTKNWRLYVFKDEKQVDLFHIHRQSAYLFGRDRIVADIPIDHPSSSKQHAVIQFRQVNDCNQFGETKTLVKPFIIDLESANGTMVNGEKIPATRYYELQSKDVIKFGYSTREFVLIPED